MPIYVQIADTGPFMVDAPSEDAYVTGILSAISGVPVRDIEDGVISPEQFAHIQAASRVMGTLPIMVCEAETRPEPCEMPKFPHLRLVP